MYFCKGYDYGEKVDLSKGDWNPKRNMWLPTRFSEIINPHNSKKALKYKELLLKNAWLTPILFLDSDSPC